MSGKKGAANGQDHLSFRVVSLISEFVDSKDLATMILVCKDWKLGLQNAYHVHYSGSFHRDPEALSSFMRFFRACTSVSFYTVKKDDSRMEDLPALLENLKGLRLVNCSISRSFMAMPLLQLRSLTLTDYVAPGKHLVDTFTQWSQLKNLVLHNCVQLKDQDVDGILRKVCPVLESLSITRSYQVASPLLLTNETPGGKEDTRSVLSTGICRLRHLVLRETPFLSFKRTLCLDPVVSQHTSFPLLEHLDLSRTAISNQVVGYFLENCQCRSPQLKTLRLTSCQRLSDSLTLSSLPSLQSLSLEFCLPLKHVKFEDCPQLQYLDLNCENLESLQLSSLGSLQRLSLVMLKLLERVRISNCKALRLLDVTGCTALPSQWIEEEHILDEIASNAVVLK